MASTQLFGVVWVEAAGPTSKGGERQESRARSPHPRSSWDPQVQDISLPAKELALNYWKNAGRASGFIIPWEFLLIFLPLAAWLQWNVPAVVPNKFKERSWRSIKRRCFRLGKVVCLAQIMDQPATAIEASLTSAVSLTLLKLPVGCCSL